MRITESIEIESDVGRVWDHVSQPELWPDFVSKIQLVEPLNDGFYRVLIGDKEVIGKIETLQPYELMRFAGQLAHRPDGKGFAIEYQLDADTRRVVVSEIQELQIPFPFNLLVKWISKRGKRTGPSNLEILKELCEKRNR